MNPIFIRPVVELIVSKTVLDLLLVNNTAQLLVQLMTQWGQYRRCKQSPGRANGGGGRMLAGGAHTNAVPYRGALWRD